MNLLNSKIVKICTRTFIFCFCFFAHVQVKAWEVDFSRRAKDITRSRLPASIVDQPGHTAPAAPSFLGGIFEAGEGVRDIVILNTESGFVPAQVNLKTGQTYQVHIVNVNDKARNASFVFDAFSEHHATYFGQKRTFTISPKQDGIFSFVCPETAFEGRVVVIPKDNRSPASQ